jgi:hypothetical protein
MSDQPETIDPDRGEIETAARRIVEVLLAHKVPEMSVRRRIAEIMTGFAINVRAGVHSTGAEERA